MPRKPKRRLNPGMTAVIAGAVVTELVTILNWLSQYSGGQLRDWQVPALAGATLMTGWLAASTVGAASKRTYYNS